MRLPRTVMNQRRHAFSLVELIVAMAIVLVLFGFIGAAAMKVRESARIAQTRTTLAVLRGISDEYLVTTKLKIPHLDGIRISEGAYVNVNWGSAKARNAPGSSGNGIIDDTDERFAWQVLQHPATGDLLRKSLPDDQFLDLDGDGFMEILDPWQNQIYYAVAVIHDDNYDNDKSDNEGTLDDDDFLPEYEGVHFASAGPDGLWGDASNPSALDNNSNGVHDHGEDNIYSYTLDF